MTSDGTRLACLVLLLLPALVLCAAARAPLNGPPYNQDLQAGPYRFRAQFSEYPPQVEHPLQVVCVMQRGAPVAGQLVARPGAGTDAVEVHAPLSPSRRTPTEFAGAIHFTVRGSWHLLVRFSGPQGPATASIDLVVSAPDALPSWLGWLIGLSPLVGCLWFAWRQYTYRSLLLHRQ